MCIICTGTIDGKQKIAVGDKRKAEEKLDSEGKDSPLSMKIGKTTTKTVAPSGISIKVGPMVYIFKLLKMVVEKWCMQHS